MNVRQKRKMFVKSGDILIDIGKLVIAGVVIDGIFEKSGNVLFVGVGAIIAAVLFFIGLFLTIKDEE